jgi:hypothetical protein
MNARQGIHTDSDPTFLVRPVAGNGYRTSLPTTFGGPVHDSIAPLAVRRPDPVPARHRSVQTTGKYLGCKQRIRWSVGDKAGIEPPDSAYDVEK